MPTPSPCTTATLWTTGPRPRRVWFLGPGQAGDVARQLLSALLRGPGQSQTKWGTTTDNNKNEITRLPHPKWDRHRLCLHQRLSVRSVPPDLRAMALCIVESKQSPPPPAERVVAPVSMVVGPPRPQPPPPPLAREIMRAFCVSSAPTHRLSGCPLGRGRILSGVGVGKYMGR